MFIYSFSIKFDIWLQCHQNKLKIIACLVNVEKLTQSDLHQYCDLEKVPTEGLNWDFMLKNCTFTPESTSSPNVRNFNHSLWQNNVEKFYF